MRETRTCQNCKTEFVIEPEDFVFYEKAVVPPPTFCWKCRFQRRLAWRNERTLFKGKSAKSGKDLVTTIPPGSGVPVYEQSEWWADDWDPMDYGRDYDFSRNFFEQFGELQRSVPYMSRNVIQMENSDYSANSGNLKNCYLLFNATMDENCAYGTGVSNSRDCFDNCNIDKCERCYGSFWLTNCYRTNFSVQCTDCVDTWLSKDCRGCSNCFGCANLSKKQYCIFNEQYTREEYDKKMKEFRLDTWSGFLAARKKAHETWVSSPTKYLQGVRNVNVSGSYITDCNNVHFCYLMRQSKDCKYCQYLQDPHNEEVYDMTIWGGNMELVYDSTLGGYGMARCKFCINCFKSIQDLEYSVFCTNSHHLFGCVGLRNKEYCILNKQYTKEEYEELIPKIKAHMDEMPYTDKKGSKYKYGEFFPIETSFYGYNNTLANEFFPLSKEKIEEEGYGWVDTDKGEYEPDMDASDIPDSWDETTDSIVGKLITCSQCKRAYRIIQSEFDFLKSENIPLPRTCVDCRHKTRLSFRMSPFLHHRTCSCGGENSSNGVYKNLALHSHHGKNPCPNEFETSYDPDRPEIVYCEECYNQEAA